MCICIRILKLSSYLTLVYSVLIMCCCCCYVVVVVQSHQYEQKSTFKSSRFKHISSFTQSNYAGDPSSFGVGGGLGTVPGPGGGGLGGGGALINDSVYTPWTVTAFTPFFFINCTNAKFASPSTEYTNASIFVFNSSACSISLAYATYQRPQTRSTLSNFFFHNLSSTKITFACSAHSNTPPWTT